MAVRTKKKTAEFDFIVVGGGMNGLCAAIAAARGGARTALVQDRPVLGGNASSEIRMHICGASCGMEKKDAEETGLLREILLENKHINDYYNYSVWDRVLFSAAREKNLTLFLNTSMVDAEAENGRVTSIRCWQLTTETEWTLRARIFADCTGNGTLAWMTGVPFRIGSEGRAEFNEPHAPDAPDSRRMGNTLLFKAVDRGEPVAFIPPADAYHFTEEQLRFRKHADLVTPDETLTEKAKTVLDALDETTKRLSFDSYCVDYGYWWIELPGKTADIISEYEDIRDELVRCIYGIWDHIKNGGDHGAANYDLQWVGMLPGIRESRRIEGDYMLTENDLLANRVFEDAVAYGGWAVDNHIERGLFDFDKMPSEIYGFPGLYTIPYRCYLAKGMENLYISGRSMSASKLAMASSRVMGTCAVGGQAIGTAAAMAIKEGKSIRGIDICALQQRLLRDDCYIPGYRNEDPDDLARQAAASADAGENAAAVLNGVARAVGDERNSWDAPAPGATLTLKWEAPVTLRQLRFTFDPNLNRSARITLSSRGIAEQLPGVPPELVRDYDVELLLGGKTLSVIPVRGNYQRLNVLELPETRCDEVRLHVLSTNGCPQVRVFEVRAYGKA